MNVLMELLKFKNQYVVIIEHFVKSSKINL